MPKSNSTTSAIAPEEHLGLVKFTVAKFLKHNQWAAYLEDDLVGIGNEALVIAAKGYDESRSSWSTYATLIIFRHLQRYAKQMSVCVKIDTNNYSKLPSSTEYNAVEPEWEPANFAEYRSGGFAPSARKRCFIAEAPSLNPEEQLMTKDARKRTSAMLVSLTQKEQDILAMRFGIGCEQLLLREIGERYGITRERVRQIEAGALAKLRRIYGKRDA